MRSTKQLSITLPNEMAELVRSRVASGEYATESEVIRDGLRALLARERALEAWLGTEVAKAYDEARTDPSSLADSKEARARIADLHARTIKSQG